MNSGSHLNNSFSHYNQQSPFAEPLRWELHFEISNVTFDAVDGIEASAQTICEAYVNEPDDDNEGDNQPIGIVRYSRSQLVHPMTGKHNFDRVEYLQRIYFGHWRNFSIIDFSYLKDEQVFVDYSI